MLSIIDIIEWLRRVISDGFAMSRAVNFANSLVVALSF